MIDFSIPENIAAQLQMTKMVAAQVMRPKARYLDEHEHERPKDFVQMMWPVMSDMQKANLRRARRQAEAAEKAESTEETEKKGPSTFNVGFIHMIEALAWGDAAQYLCTPGYGLGTAAVVSVGTLEQKERLLTRFTEGDPKWDAMAVTEPGAGSDVSSITTTAVLDKETNEWVLNGEKIFCTNGGLALNESDGFVIVWATVDRSAGRAGIKSFVVEAGTPGVTVTKAEIKHGIRASDTVSISLSDARIPHDNILGNAEVIQRDDTTKGFKGVMKTFDATRPIVAASTVGVARAAVEIVKEKLAEAGITIRYDAAPHELTAIERDVIEMEAQLKASWLLVLRAASMMDHQLPNALESSMCKAKAGRACTRICQMAVAILGPMGYSREWLVEKLMRDSKIADIYEGTQQINQLIVARRVLEYSSKDLR